MKQGGHCQTNQKGFSLIEIIIAVAILAMIVVAASVSFRNSRNVNTLTTAGNNVLSVIRVAQSKTLAGENDSEWGIHIETDKITLFRGSVFAGSPYTEATLLPTNIEIANISLAGGGTDIIFTRITGATAETGSFDIRVKDDTSIVFPVTIEASGKVLRTGTAPAVADTRVTDARHKAFTLGWSIKTAATTTLIFANPPYPNTTVDITMAPFFDGTKSKFDWSNSITVGTTTQTLRIHTTSLSDIDTILHVDRDCRKNTLSLTIQIDTKEIATYATDCRTVTVGAFGGTMTEP